MADVKSLNDLFHLELRRIYDAEQRLVKALPAMVKAASSTELRQALQAHFEETEAHVDRVEQVFGFIGEKPKTDTCEAIKGLVKDAEDMMAVDVEGDLKDAGLIAAAQEVEHFEIAAYGTLRTWAVTMNNTEAMHVLEWTLEEEKNADKLLTQVASRLNLRAAQTPANG
jgi:ferritin-like metal-binding protein YciE